MSSFHYKKNKKNNTFFPFHLDHHEEHLIHKKYPKNSQAYEEFQTFVQKLFQEKAVLHQKSLKECISLLKLKLQQKNQKNKIDLNQVPVFIRLSILSQSLKASSELSIDISVSNLVHLIMAIFDDFLSKKLKSAQSKMKSFRQSLPIHGYKQTIIDQVQKNQVVLIAADTGAGKSTQVPQYLMEAGFDKIACTQPRRIACFSLAKRVSEESLNMFASEIAYQVRFDQSKTSTTKILFLTEGILLRNLNRDPLLRMYNLIIIDEVHERHITGDFLLSCLKYILSKRQDLKIVLMSATINAELFSNFFNAPIIQVPGRMYPVRIEYIPIEAEEDKNLVDDRSYKERIHAKIPYSVATAASLKSSFQPLNSEPYLKILRIIDQTVSAHERGDLLIFLPGLNEISSIADTLREYAGFSRRWIVLSLYSTLSIKEQEKVFGTPPEGIRKCILSTNIAETSITIDGVRFIVDSGKVKEMSYDPQTGISKLSEFWISKSSAKQRAGRAGRTGPGICYRFYTENEFIHMNEFPIPEILRSPLDSVLLQIFANENLPSLSQFQFLQQPDTRIIQKSIERLMNVGALESLDANHSLSSVISQDQGILSLYKERESLITGYNEIDERQILEQMNELYITPIGRVLSTLPVDVILGKMLILAMISKLIDPMVVIAAGLCIPSPFLKIKENVQHDVKQRRKEVYSDEGDPFTLLYLFNSWLEVKTNRKDNSRQWSKRMAVEEQRLYEIVKLKSQFEAVIGEINRSQFSIEEEGDDNHEDKEKIKTFKTDEKRKHDHMGYHAIKETKELLIKKKRKSGLHKRKVLSYDEEMIKDETQEYEDLEYRQEEEQEGNQFKKQGYVNENEIDGDPSIQELEFKLKHDPKLLLDKVNKLSHRDIDLIKLILCSGLYPNIAIPDEANVTRRSSEGVFHTKSKRFTVMHPSSIYSIKPDLLYPNEYHKQYREMKVQEEDILVTDDLKSQRKSSESDEEKLPETRYRTKEVACFLECIETTKPYLNNVFKVEAAPVLILFAQNLDISPDMQHVVVDFWLHLYFNNSFDAQQFIVDACKLRYMWLSQIDKRLNAFYTRNRFQSLGIGQGTSQDDNQDNTDDFMYGTRLIQTPSNSSQNDIITNKSPSESLYFRKENKTKIKKMPTLPIAVQKIRQDFEKCIDLLEDVDNKDNKNDHERSAHFIVDELEDLLQRNLDYSVQRLKMQEWKSIFGYDPYLPESKDKYMVQLTNNVRYYKSNNHKFELIGPKSISLHPTCMENRKLRSSKFKDNQEKIFVCPDCRKEISVLNAIDKLRHKKICGSS